MSEISQVASTNLYYPMQRVDSFPKIQSDSVSVPISFSGNENADKKKSHTGLYVVGGLAVTTVAGLIFKKDISKALKIGRYSFKNLTEAETKAVDKLVADGKLPQDYKDIFVQIRDLKGDNFSKRAYELIAEKFGYKNCAPKLRTKNNSDVSSSFAGHSGEILLSQRKMDNIEMFESIRHEFQHFIQESTVIRTEGLGPEAYLKARVAGKMKSLSLHNDICKKERGKIYSEFSADELKALEQKLYDSYKADFNYDFYAKVTKEKGMIKAGSEEAGKAELYRQAISEYTGLGNITKKPPSEFTEEDRRFATKYYFSNLLEKEAYGVGKAVKSYYEAFLAAISGSK